MVHNSLAPNNSTKAYKRPIHNPFTKVAMHIPRSPRGRSRRRHSNRRQRNRRHPHRRTTFSRRRRSRKRSRHRRTRRHTNASRRVTFLIKRTFRRVHIPTRPCTHLKQFGPFPRIRSLTTIIHIRFLAIVQTIVPVSNRAVPPSQLFFPKETYISQHFSRTQHIRRIHPRKSNSKGSRT